MAMEGAKVVATGRSEAEGAETAAQIRAAGGDGIYLKHDISDEGAWVTVIAEAERRFGGLDVLVNNAGMFFLADRANQRRRLESIYRVNVEGTFLGISDGMAAMDKRGGSSIVNVSSRSAFAASRTAPHTARRKAR
jgi:NAD(P)-dependent dehydrogenase (short-subunit alcohol dehydrogenase family)